MQDLMELVRVLYRSPHETAAQLPKACLETITSKKHLLDGLAITNNELRQEQQPPIYGTVCTRGYS